MNGKEIEKKHHQTFGDLKQENDAGMEFWYASDLQTVLDYSTWDKFKRVIQKAITACDNSGQPAENHFSQVVKMVRIGSSAQREIEDFELSRYAWPAISLCRTAISPSRSSPTDRPISPFRPAVTKDSTADWMPREFINARGS